MAIMKQELRATGLYDAEAVSDASAISEFEPTLAQQNMKDECDINTIVGRFGLGGKLPELPRMEDYVDASGVTTFEGMMQHIRGAEEAFMEFPADVRRRFGDDPGQMLMFLQDDKNRPEAEKLGLVLPPKEKTRDVVTAVDELARALTTPKV